MAIELPRSRLIPLDRVGARIDIQRAVSMSWMAVGAAGMIALILLLTGLAPVPTFGSMMGPLPKDPIPSQSTRIYDVHGKLIATLHAEEDRIVIARAQMPKHLRLAVLAVEDHDFYRHGGVKPSSVMRALLANVLAKKIEQGGSTITQQYVRNAYREIGRERSITRKIKEAVLSIGYEREHGKEEILDRYLNTVYFGRGAYGVEAAARTYFGKSARALSLDQSAFLAGVIHAPEAYVTNKKAALRRRNRVLSHLWKLGFVSHARAHRAALRPLRFHNDPTERVRAAYFVEYVRRQLLRPVREGGFGLKDADILTGGLSVYTTLDLRMQDAAERAVRAVLDREDDPEAALVAMTTDGEVRAMVGGRNFTSVARARGFNFATQKTKDGGRQPGSSFKPFTLAAYIARGYSVYRHFPAPSRIAVPKCANPGSVWTPRNYQNMSYGSLDVIEATEKSVNTVYAQMVSLVGPAQALEVARDAGIVSGMDPVCSIALGAFPVTPLEMSRAYATLSAHGERPNVLAIRRVVGPNGHVFAVRRPHSEQTMDRAVADKVTAILERVVQHGTGVPARISRPAAGKTGTTNEHRDVWFCGYTPHPGLSAAVWIGNPPDKHGHIRAMTSLHGRPATGGYFAGGIWRRFMDEAVKGSPVRSFTEVDLHGGRYGETLREVDAIIRRHSDASVTVTTTPSPTQTRRKKRHSR